MNCRRCNGLMVVDVDRESVTGWRCVNCGCDGTIRDRPEEIEIDPPEDGCTFYQTSQSPRVYCGDDRAPGSKHCPHHQALTRKRNNVRQDRKPRARGVSVPFIPLGLGRGRRG